MEAKYVTVSGHTVELDPSGEDAAFLDRLVALAHRTGTTSNDLIALAYSHENPFLDHSTHPTLGLVTKETLENPAYRVLGDVLFRKSLDESGESVESLADAHTMIVSETAAELDMHESAVRQAIKAGKLASWVKDGKHYMKPSAVEAYAKTSGPRRGPARQEGSASSLFVRVGHSPDGTMKIAGHSGLRAQRRLGGNVNEGWVDDVEVLGALTESPDGHARFFLLHVGATQPEDELAFHGFLIRGRFSRVITINAAGKARAAWKDFRQAAANVGQADLAGFLREAGWEIPRSTGETR